MGNNCGVDNDVVDVLSDDDDYSDSDDDIRCNDDISKKYSYGKSYDKYYWVGPYGILVSNDIDHIIATDGCNVVDKIGHTTKMRASNPISKKTYIEKYARLSNDGKYYYYEKEKKDKPKNKYNLYGHDNFVKRCESNTQSMNDNNISDYDTDYWVGPYGILVHKSVNSVISNNGNKYTYVEKYALLGDDGRYYHINNNYWEGTYGVWVLKDIIKVVSCDDTNHLHSDETKKQRIKVEATPMGENAYKHKYATLINGKYYFSKDKCGINKGKWQGYVVDHQWKGPYGVLGDNCVVDDSSDEYTDYSESDHIECKIDK